MVALGAALRAAPEPTAADEGSGGHVEYCRQGLPENTTTRRNGGSGLSGAGAVRGVMRDLLAKFDEHRTKGSTESKLRMLRDLLGARPAVGGKCSFRRGGQRRKERGHEVKGPPPEARTGACTGLGGGTSSGSLRVYFCFASPRSALEQLQTSLRVGNDGTA